MREIRLHGRKFPGVAGSEGNLHALLELGGVETAFGRVGAKTGDGRVTVGVGHPQLFSTGRTHRSKHTVYS